MLFEGAVCRDEGGKVREHVTSEVLVSERVKRKRDEKRTRDVTTQDWPLPCWVRSHGRPP